MNRAKEVLKSNMKGLTELAEILLEREVIFSEDLEKIFGKRKADRIKEEQGLKEQNSANAVKKETGAKEIKKEESGKSEDDILKTGSGKNEKNDEKDSWKQVKKSKTKDK